MSGTHEDVVGMRVYTVAEVIRDFRIGRTKLYSEIKEGRVKVLKLGRKTLIRGSSLKAWLEGLEAAENNLGPGPVLKKKSAAV